eukprot:TRINITY_DN13292_c0_g9_i1.p1 TRINITY_DN13292_c0_g9~~TRINITY_DN13292_c0_g9_i1.p1  ORF type:complete len:151 (-),score=27.06 TRINITY_DN13292_c0_g9_i1:45-497(-)
MGNSSTCGCEDRRLEHEDTFNPKAPGYYPEAQGRAGNDEHSSFGGTAPYTFTFVINKAGSDDALGVDVKHSIKGHLTVVQILPEGALKRSIDECAAKGMEFVQVGDIIQQVNDITADDRAMVAECKSASMLNLRMLRPPAHSRQSSISAA